jgi:nucleoid DNA-binding protein
VQAAADRTAPRFRGSGNVQSAPLPFGAAAMSLVEDITEETLIFELGNDSEGNPRSGAVNRDVIRVVWEAFSTYVEKQIDQKKAVNIPNFGKFTFLVEKGGPQGTKFKEPVFIFNDAFLKQNGLRARSIPRGSIMPSSTELNLSMVAMLASQSKDVVSSVMQQFIRSIAKAMEESASNGKIRMRIKVQNVGKICCQQGMCKFAYDASYGCTRPGTNETCRTSASRASLASRASVLGGSEGPISSNRELNAAMKGAVGRPSSSALATNAKPKQGYGNSELMSIDEMRDGDPEFAEGGEAEQWDAGADAQEQPPAPSSGSALIDGIMNYDNDQEFNESDVENMLDQGGGNAGAHHPLDMEDSYSRASQSRSGMSVDSRASGTSDVLPVYLCPEMTRSSRRIQRQKQIVAQALDNAYQRYDKTLEKNLETVSRENQLFEAELRRQTQAANELRSWRRANLHEQQKTHKVQMQAAHDSEQQLNASMKVRFAASLFACIDGYASHHQHFSNTNVCASPITGAYAWLHQLAEIRGRWSAKDPGAAPADAAQDTE